ncbi:DBH-like monooxygenase protein 1 [Folsomia candida]|nr:DBH-like monooxygenase protein 1 [Folsomia candida]
MKGADIGIAKIFPGGIISFEDRYGIDKVSPILDKSQDWHLLSSNFRKESTVSFQVSRLLNTGDSAQDVEITEDTLRLIWATGKFETDTGKLHYHENGTRGVIPINFLDPDMDTPSHEELSNMFDLWNPKRKTHLSRNETTYICSFFKSPDIPKRHVIGFGLEVNPIENLRHVHHLDLYRCSAPSGTSPTEFFAPFVGNDYDCSYSPVQFPFENCLQFEFTWSEGGGITLFPENMGLPLQPNEYYMTQTHYDNPHERDDIVLETGFNIYLTSNLRPIEVGQLYVGFMTSKSYALTVPPNSTNFTVSSHCSSPCTSNLPPEGINTFSVMLHSHNSGRRMQLRQFRSGTELPPLAKDDYYDFNYQNNRRLRETRKIMPGDHLTVECVYDTVWKGGKSVLGGRSARDEMCIAFLLYWPRIENVNLCGSYHDQEQVLNFMGVEKVYQYQGEVDATIIEPSHLAGLKYSHVVENLMNWSLPVRERYQKFAQYGEQHAFCHPTVGLNESMAKTAYPKIILTRESRAGWNIGATGIIVMSIILQMCL